MAHKQKEALSGGSTTPNKFVGKHATTSFIVAKPWTSLISSEKDYRLNNADEASEQQWFAELKRDARAIAWLTVGIDFINRLYLGMSLCLLIAGVYLAPLWGIAAILIPVFMSLSCGLIFLPNILRRAKAGYRAFVNKLDSTSENLLTFFDKVIKRIQYSTETDVDVNAADFKVRLLIRIPNFSLSNFAVQQLKQMILRKCDLTFIRQKAMDIWTFEGEQSEVERAVTMLRGLTQKTYLEYLLDVREPKVKKKDRPDSSLMQKMWRQIKGKIQDLWLGARGLKNFTKLLHSILVMVGFSMAILSAPWWTAMLLTTGAVTFGILMARLERLRETQSKQSARLGQLVRGMKQHYFEKGRRFVLDGMKDEIRKVLIIKEKDKTPWSSKFDLTAKKLRLCVTGINAAYLGTSLVGLISFYVSGFAAGVFFPIAMCVLFAVVLTFWDNERFVKQNDKRLELLQKIGVLQRNISGFLQNEFSHEYKPVNCERLLHPKLVKEPVAQQCYQVLAALFRAIKNASKLMFALLFIFLSGPPGWVLGIVAGVTAVASGLMMVSAKVEYDRALHLRSLEYYENEFIEKSSCIEGWKAEKLCQKVRGEQEGSIAGCMRRPVKQRAEQPESNAGAAGECELPVDTSKAGAKKTPVPVLPKNNSIVLAPAAMACLS